MNMILITLSTFLAVIVIQTHIRTDRTNKVPIWLKKVRDHAVRFKRSVNSRLLTRALGAAYVGGGGVNLMQF